MRAKSARNRWLQRGGLALAGGLLALVVAEAALRLTLSHKLQFDLAWTRPDPELGWVNRPHWRGTFHVEGRTQNLRTGPLGLRGVDRLARTPTRPRVLWLGDSTTAGYEVAEDQTFAALTAQALNVESLNAGTRGWATDQCERFLRREGKRLQPAVVVYTFCLNDLTGNTDISKPRYQRRDGRLVWVQPRVNARRRLETWLRQHCYIWRLVVWARIRAASRRPTPAGAPHWMQEQAALYRIDPDRDASWQLTLSLMDRMRQWCREHNARLFVMPFVERLEISEAWRAHFRRNGASLEGCDFKRVHETLRRYCAQNNIGFVEARAALLSECRDRCWGEHDPHWFESGHRLAARALVSALRPILPDSSRAYVGLTPVIR